MKLDSARPFAESAGLTVLQRQLSELAGELDARFIDAGTILASTNATIGRLIGTLDTLVGALDARSAGTAAQTLSEGARMLEALPAMQAERLADIGLIRHGTTELQVHAAQIREAMRVLSLHGTNLRVLATGAPALADLVEPLFMCFDDGEAQLEVFAAELAELAAHVASTQRVARLFGAECVKVVPAVPQKLAENAESLRAHQLSVGAGAASIGAIARGVSDRASVLLCALQIGDITRQRIEHVVAALQLLGDSEGANPAEAAAAAHLLRLLAAQLVDTAGEFDEQAHVLLAGLAELAPDAARLLALMEACGADGGEGKRDFFHVLERGIADVDRLTEQLSVANQRSRALARALGETFLRLVGRADTLGLAYAELQRIAAAVQLRAADLGMHRAVALEIADAMLVCVARLDGARAGIAKAIDMLANADLGTRHRGRFEAQIAASQGLARSLASIRLACRRTEQGLGETVIDARELVETLDEAGARLQRELQLGATIRGIADAMRALAGGDQAIPESADTLLRALLPRVASCYSMTRERDIHRGHLLPGMELACPAEIAEDDDGLF